MDKKNIEAIYPLAPLQQMFLLHSLSSSSKAGLLHMRCNLSGIVDSKLLKQAWDYVVSRHPALRTSVHWQSVKQPLQVVARRVTIPWVKLDWRNVDDPKQELIDFLAEDRDRGFDLTQSPIMRLTLIRLSETGYELVWSCHHLMLDGWSGALVFNQVFDCYEALFKGELLPSVSAATYQSYIRWLKQQDEAEAINVWAEALSGFTTPTPLPSTQTETTLSDTPPDYSVTLSPEITATLQELLRSQRLTLSTLLQGVWSLLLHHYSCETDILFGMTVSGRQGDLTEIESIVGLLSNVLPVRVQIHRNQALLPWLRELQRQQSQISRYAYISPTQIQAWSGLSDRLFDSLLVIENFPIRTTSEDCSLSVENIQSGIVSAYGLTVIAKPGDTLTLMLYADAKRFSDNVLITLLNQFEAVLNKISTTPEKLIHELLRIEDGMVIRTQPKYSPMEEKLGTRIVKSQTPDKTKQSLCQHLPESISPSTFSSLDRQLLIPDGEPQKRALPISYKETSLDLTEESTTAVDELELYLIQMWKRLLNIPVVNTTDNFFDLGGHSLLAVQLFTEIEKSFGKKLPLATLFHASTIEALAQIIRKKDWLAPWGSLVSIKPTGTNRPLFYLHPSGGSLLGFRDLALSLDENQPVYGLQPRGLDGKIRPSENIEEIAKFYISQIQKVQPHGPYYLAGLSSGGMIAWEMTQQLKDQGESVDLLALFDTSGPNSIQLLPLFPRLFSVLSWIFMRALDLPGQTVKYFKKHGLKPTVKQAFITARLTKKALEKDSSILKHNNKIRVNSNLEEYKRKSYKLSILERWINSLLISLLRELDEYYANIFCSELASINRQGLPDEIMAVSQANFRAREAYVPKELDGKATIFRASERIPGFKTDPNLGWQGLALQGIEFHEIKGTHSSMMRSPILVEKLKKCLEKAQNSTSRDN